MRTRLTWMLVGVCLSAAIGAVIAAGPAEKPRMTWEYKFVNSFDQPLRTDNAGDDEGPNVLGAQGWELVSTTVESSSPTRYTLFYSAQVDVDAYDGMTVGPYARIRHPMYSAIIGWLLSLGLVDANWIPLVFALLAALNFILRIRGEEQMMLQQFGDEYREYMKRTGKLLPV